MPTEAGPPLEYANPGTPRARNRWSRRWRRRVPWRRWWWRVLLLLGVLSGIGWWATSAYVERKASVLVDCNVPGTELWVENRKLGTLPLRLSPKRLTEWGLPSPPTLSEFFLGSGDDGWGEGLFVGVEDEQETKLMFRVPSAVASQYLQIEAPWGRRTKAGGGLTFPGSFRIDMLPAVEPSGLKLALSPLPVARRGSQTVSLQFTMTNVGKKAITGYHPGIEAFWGTFHTPWRRRTVKGMDLLLEWAKFVPGDKRTATIEIPMPNVSEDYSVFVIFNLYADPQLKTGMDAVYSDSRLLRVR